MPVTTWSRLAGRAPVLLAAALAVAMAAPAAAQDDKQRQAALDKFERGKALMIDKRYDEACRAFQTSLDLLRGVGTLYNLAECRIALGQRAAAWKLYRDAAWLARDQGARDRAAAADERAKAIEQEVALVRLELAEAPAGAKLTIDDKAADLRSWRETQALDPGAHRFVLRAPGRRPWKLTTTFAAATDRTITVPPLAAASDTSEDDAPRSLPPERIGGIVLGAIGLVGLGTGIGFGVVALKKSSEYQPLCDDQGRCPDGAIALHDQAKRAAVGADVALALGGAAVIAATVLWLVPRRDARPRAMVMPIVAPGTAMIGFTRRW